MLEFGQVGVTTVGHYLHDASGALRGGGGTEGLVYVEGYGKETVIAVVGKFGKRDFGYLGFALFAFFILLRLLVFGLLVFGGFRSFGAAFRFALSLDIGVSKYQSTSE